MKNLFITLFILTIFKTPVFSQETNELNLIQQDGMTEDRPETYTKYTLENESVKILVFKIDYGEPALNPLHFNAYFQCKSNNKYFKLDRRFNNAEESYISYCGHDNFYLGTIKDQGDKKFLILPMKKDANHVCPASANSIEVYPISEMIQKCDQ